MKIRDFIEAVVFIGLAGLIIALVLFLVILFQGCAVVPKPPLPTGFVVPAQSPKATRPAFVFALPPLPQTWECSFDYTQRQGWVPSFFTGETSTNNVDWQTNVIPNTMAGHYTFSVTNLSPWLFFKAAAWR